MEPGPRGRAPEPGRAETNDAVPSRGRRGTPPICRLQHALVPVEALAEELRGPNILTAVPSWVEATTHRGRVGADSERGRSPGTTRGAWIRLVEGLARSAG